MSRAPVTVILASSSPRRRDLLNTLGFQFRIEVPDVEEQLRHGEDAESYVQRNSLEKCQVISDKTTGEEGAILVIAADTVVVLGHQILEKPLDKQHARQMLESLSGKEHSVLSGVSIGHLAQAGSWEYFTFCTTTSVSMKHLNEREIEHYIASGEPLDKAGSYAAQGLGSYMVESIEGSYANVVGLPVAQLCDAIESRFGISLWDLRV